VGREYFWSAAAERLLGRWPDAEVAKRLGRSITAVERHRWLVGIKFHENRRWTKAEERLLAQSLKGPRRRSATRELGKQLGRSQTAVEAHRRAKFGRVQRTPRSWIRREERLLGTRTDDEVGRLIGRARSVVAMRRYRLGIPSTVSRRPWTPAEDRLLGTASDEALSRKLGRSRTSISGRRCKLGIARFPRPGAWTPEEDRLLGTAPDRKLARRLGRTLTSVQVRRRIKKMPSVWPTAIPWSAREDALLGTQPDAEVARVLGRGLAGVRRRRMLLHIRLKQWTNVLKGNIRKWTSAEVRLLGRRPDRKLAEQLGRGYRSVVAKRLSLGRAACPSGPRPTWWKPREVRLLGVVPDREVARRVGRSLAAVQTRRRLKGVPPPPPKTKPWRASEDDLLGSQPDEEIARLLGRAPDAVRKRRISLGVPFSERPAGGRHWTMAEELLVGNPTGPRGGAATGPQPSFRNKEAAEPRTTPSWRFSPAGFAPADCVEAPGVHARAVPVPERAVAEGPDQPGDRRLAGHVADKLGFLPPQG
jgi:hypothetical protein